ncbi:MAG: peptidase domain-containing ABC transporter [Deltaproteobacteria bacterium]|nr:peptidase domain-containing ABC transporter [Deltaproteobacteria bacterium]
MKFPFYQQLDSKDCGPTCLRMIAKFYGREYSLQSLRDLSGISRSGISLLGLSGAAESLGMRTMGVKISFDQLQKDVPLPCIVHWSQNHFVVIYKVTKKKVFVADPDYGHIVYTKKDFLNQWISTRHNDEELGICLLIEPTPVFHEQDNKRDDEKFNYRFALSYLKPYKKFIFQLFIGLITASLIQLIFPFLTQSIVDIGIDHQDLGFIYLILIAQLMLFISRMSIDFIRGWLLLHISTRINISIISDFLIKLMKLPIGFFDTKIIGDIIQRIDDHQRIESFLTSSTLNILFSMINLVVFGIVLALFNLTIFSVFLAGSILYIFWLSLFVRKRRVYDYKRFEQLSLSQSNVIQLISGIQEIKLNNCEKQKRWEWENIQAKLFKVSVKNLSLHQYQQIGGFSINETKNILISFLAVKAVIAGDMTLGTMLAIQYILGQLNSPIEQMIEFIHSIQDAKISMERLWEIHKKEDEETNRNTKITSLPEKRDLHISGLSFQYSGAHSQYSLLNINFQIPSGKVTAVVGKSGSGKTTLLRLLLGFYPPSSGSIYVGKKNLTDISEHFWRSKCGVVMQDGFIFSDTIAENITVSSEIIDNEKLLNAAKVANIHEYIESLPLGYNTKIGEEGPGLSQGQKQRILIARAVYKNPEFLFFDEATNALDAENEQIIMRNLENFFRGKTVVVVAHRLSTVKNADQIIVLDKGSIIETGHHHELTQIKGKYYQLVKNQLELVAS